MVEAHHSSASGTPVGYIITFPDNYTIYHAGDTSIFASMQIYGELFDIDLAMLPIGGVFTMDPRQAALACKLLQCKNVVPMHWGSFPVLEKDTLNFQAALKEFAAGINCIDMSPGQTIDL
jgi:L-ascorbate metabolism protein UlaG (beta-lactamase superfamily)